MSSRRLPRDQVVLEADFLSAWLQAAGLEERLLLAADRLPLPLQSLESWDLWLQLQATLLRSPLPETLEAPLLARIARMGGDELLVQALPPAGRLPALQHRFDGVRGAASALEAVRLAWAALLSAAEPLRDLLGSPGRVSVRTCRAGAGAVELSLPAQAPSSSAPDPCILRLAELHGRLVQPPFGGEPRSLLDLRPLVDLEGAAPDADAEACFLQAADAAGCAGVRELLERARGAWCRWVAAAETSRGAPPAAGCAADPARHRQLAGAPAAPGLAEGRAWILRDGSADAPAGGAILVCDRLPSRGSARAGAAAGVVCEEGGRLGFTAVLAARAGIPCVCGVRGATTEIADGDWLLVDGQLGIVTLGPARASIAPARGAPPPP